VAHQSLYRRYRPRRFSEIIGQEHVVRALRNAVRDDRVGHAYLFSGPRGTGKTSSARILAKVLNCEDPTEGEPCGACPSCVAVDAGVSFDVHELDAASNRGIDDIRELRARANQGTPGRTKVYILDEAHMLTLPANAALLKTLEEPPAHVVFVLATTEPQKMPDTIRSRTQHLEFHLVPTDELERHVRWVVGDAGLEVDDAAIDAVVAHGAGSVRDALSALDQVVAAGGIAPDAEPLDELVEALIAQDPGRALAGAAAALHLGRDPRGLAETLVGHLRDMFLSLMATDLVQLPDRRAAVVADQAERLGAASTVRAMEVIGETLVEIRHAPDPRVLVEVALVRLTSPAVDASPGALVARIEKLEQAVAAGGLHPVATSSSGRARLGSAVTPRDPPSSRGERAPAPPSPAPPSPAPPPQAGPDAPPRREAPDARPSPSPDELQQAFADAKLTAHTRALLAAGRFVTDATGQTVLALPNEPHRARCEPLRAELEEALVAVVGRPVTVMLAVQDTSKQGRLVRDDAVDPSELIDGPAEADDGPVARLTRAFPGSELVEEG
jgi:DNA polymerase-3 subunit gamma/tau